MGEPKEASQSPALQTGLNERPSIKNATTLRDYADQIRRATTPAEKTEAEDQPKKSFLQKRMSRRRLVNLAAYGAAAGAAAIGVLSGSLPGIGGGSAPSGESSDKTQEFKDQREAQDEQVDDLLTEVRTAFKEPYQGMFSAQKEKWLDERGRDLRQRLKDNGYRVMRGLEISEKEKETPEFNFNNADSVEGVIIPRLNTNLTYRQNGDLVRVDMRGQMETLKLPGMETRTIMMDVEPNPGVFVKMKVLQDDALKDAVKMVVNLPVHSVWTANLNPTKKDPWAWKVHGTDAKGRDVDFAIDHRGNFEYAAAKDAKG